MLDEVGHRTSSLYWMRLKNHPPLTLFPPLPLLDNIIWTLRRRTAAAAVAAVEARVGRGGHRGVNLYSSGATGSERKRETDKDTGDKGRSMRQTLELRS